MWIAQEYVHQDHERNMSVEDVGEEYFKILLANCLFQDIEIDQYQNIRSCKMHDAVHGLAEFVSKSEIWISNLGLMDDLANIRHIRLQSEHIRTKFEKFHCQKIRSILSDVKVDKNTLRGLEGMRVLDIRGSCTTDLSTTFVGVKHLQYLDISQSSIAIQPRWIAKLCKLQTLRFENYHGQRKPFRDVEHLINLKHIIFNNPDLTPSYIGKLIYLQTLSIFAVKTKKGHGIEELGSLKHLRGELELQRLENVKGKSNAYEADMEGKPKLQKLTYVWSNLDRQNEAKDVLEGLKPHRDLLELHISKFGGESFSSWLSDHDLLGRLRRLELIDCKRCIELPTLGEMSSLEYLAIKGIRNVKSIGIEFYRRGDQAGAVSGGVTLFPSLIELEMDYMSKLEEWVAPIEEGIITFPSLEILSVTNCQKLTTIPVIQSKSLRKLHISGCENLSNLEGVNGCGLVDLFIRYSGISILPTFSNSLQYIHISNLPKLQTIPENIGDSTCLVQFEIYHCEALTNMPTRLRSCESLQTLSIRYCRNLKNVPENLGEMSSLENLGIGECPKEIGVVNVPICHQRLKGLTIGGFTEMEEFPNLDDRVVNSSVESFDLVGWYGLRSIPNLQHFTHLKELQISFFAHLEVLPEWFGNLSSLVKLVITNCDILGSLPQSMARLTNLKQLRISYCPILASKLRTQEDRTEYSKIAHIKSINIDIW